MTSEYKIGATEVGMVTLDSLGIPNPLGGFQEYSQEADRADGGVAGLGWSTEIWNWLFLPITKRTVLKGYCAGKSSEVYIRTIKAGKTYSNYRVMMIWQKKETIRSDKVLDFSIQFRILEEL